MRLQEHFFNGLLIAEKAVVYYHAIVPGSTEADLEDLFEVGEYLALFNAAFKDQYQVAMTDLPEGVRIVDRIARAIKRDRFNHYRPAKYVISNQLSTFSDSALDRFEHAFAAVNKMFKTD